MQVGKRRHQHQMFQNIKKGCWVHKMVKAGPLGAAPYQIGLVNTREKDMERKTLNQKFTENKDIKK